MALGFDLGAAFDLDADALETHSAVLGTRVVRADLSRAHIDDIASEAGLQNGTTSMVIGGPPCTGFSHAGFWLDRKRNGRDPQVDRLEDYGRIVAHIRPVVFVLENVPGITFKNFRTKLDAFKTAMTEAGYRLTACILNSADYGVPQKRRRYVMVGSRARGQFELPEPALAGNHRGAGWALRNLPARINPREGDEEHRGRYMELLPEVPPGDNYLYFTARRGHETPLFKWRSKYWSFLKKLSPDQPASTIPARRISNNGPFHWNNRHLRIREMARLQTFPDAFQLAEPKRARAHVGNAMPPLLAANVFESLRRHLRLPIAEETAAAFEAAMSPGSSYGAVNALFTPYLNISQGA